MGEKARIVLLLFTLVCVGPYVVTPVEVGTHITQSILGDEGEQGNAVQVAGPSGGDEEEEDPSRDNWGLMGDSDGLPQGGPGTYALAPQAEDQLPGANLDPEDLRPDPVEEYYGPAEQEEEGKQVGRADIEKEDFDNDLGGEFGWRRDVVDESLTGEGDAGSPTTSDMQKLLQEGSGNPLNEGDTVMLLQTKQARPGALAESEGIHAFGSLVNAMQRAEMGDSGAMERPQGSTDHGGAGLRDGSQSVPRTKDGEEEANTGSVDASNKNKGLAQTFAETNPYPFPAPLLPADVYKLYNWYDWHRANSRVYWDYWNQFPYDTKSYDQSPYNSATIQKQLAQYPEPTLHKGGFNGETQLLQLNPAWGGQPPLHGSWPQSWEQRAESIPQEGGFDVPPPQDIPKPPSLPQDIPQEQATQQGDLDTPSPPQGIVDFAPPRQGVPQRTGFGEPGTKDGEEEASTGSVDASNKNKGLAQTFAETNPYPFPAPLLPADVYKLYNWYDWHRANSRVYWDYWNQFPYDTKSYDQSPYNSATIQKQLAQYPEPTLHKGGFNGETQFLQLDGQPQPGAPWMQGTVPLRGGWPQSWEQRAESIPQQGGFDVPPPQGIPKPPSLSQDIPQEQGVPQQVDLDAPTPPRDIPKPPSLSQDIPQEQGVPQQVDLDAPTPPRDIPKPPSLSQDIPQEQGIPQQGGFDVPPPQDIPKPPSLSQDIPQEQDTYVPEPPPLQKPPEYETPPPPPPFQTIPQQDIYIPPRPSPQKPPELETPTPLPSQTIPQQGTYTPPPPLPPSLPPPPSQNPVIPWFPSCPSPCPPPHPPPPPPCPPQRPPQRPPPPCPPPPCPPQRPPPPCPPPPPPCPPQPVVQQCHEEVMSIPPKQEYHDEIIHIPQRQECHDEIFQIPQQQQNTYSEEVMHIPQQQQVCEEKMVRIPERQQLVVDDEVSVPQHDQAVVCRPKAQCTVDVSTSHSCPCWPTPGGCPAPENVVLGTLMSDDYGDYPSWDPYRFDWASHYPPYDARRTGHNANLYHPLSPFTLPWTPATHPPQGMFPAGWASSSIAPGYLSPYTPCTKGYHPPPGQPFSFLQTDEGSTVGSHNPAPENVVPGTLMGDDYGDYPSWDPHRFDWASHYGPYDHRRLHGNPYHPWSPYGVPWTPASHPPLTSHFPAGWGGSSIGPGYLSPYAPCTRGHSGPTPFSFLQTAATNPAPENVVPGTLMGDDYGDYPSWDPHRFDWASHYGPYDHRRLHGNPYHPWSPYGVPWTPASHPPLTSHFPAGWGGSSIGPGYLSPYAPCTRGHSGPTPFSFVETREAEVSGNTGAEGMTSDGAKAGSSGGGAPVIPVLDKPPFPFPGPLLAHDVYKRPNDYEWKSLEAPYLNYDHQWPFNAAPSYHWDHAFGGPDYQAGLLHQYPDPWYHESYYKQPFFDLPNDSPRDHPSGDAWAEPYQSQYPVFGNA